MNSRQSTKIGKKTILEGEDGTFAVHFQNDNVLVLLRFVVQLGRRVPQLALLDDATDENSAQILTGRIPQRAIAEAASRRAGE